MAKTCDKGFAKSELICPYYEQLWQYTNYYQSNNQKTNRPGLQRFTENVVRTVVNIL